MNSTTKRAPVQGSRTDPQGKIVNRVPGSIEWEEHLKAYEVYARKYGREQSPERLAARDGFGWFELVELLGHEPRTWVPCPGGSQ